MPKMQFDGLAALTPAIYKSEVQLVPPPSPQLAFKKFPEKIHLLQETYVCHNRHNKKQYTHDVLRQESFNNSVLGLGLKTLCSGLVK